MKCPICQDKKGSKITSIDCGNFDNSPLYRYANIVSCRKCGHVYNKLNRRDIFGLIKYYNQEYSPNNLSSSSFGGDRPGSTDKFSLIRYKNLYKLLKPLLNPEKRILDGGCATGGFLDFLSQKGFKKLYGIDISKKYIAVAQKSGHKIKLGSVEKMPFGKSSFEVMIMDQVLEHLINPSTAFREAKRVLSLKGLLCISVPDAARYKEKPFFDFYWFLLREHVEHFNLEHLKYLGLLNGFDLIDYSMEESPMMSREMVLPTLNVVFRLQSKNDPARKTARKSFDLKKKIIAYVKQELKIQDRRKENIEKLIVSGKPLYFYGMSREFLYLYKLGLNKCNIAGLIDDTPFKQKKLRLDNRRIYDSSILKNAPKDSCLIITAFAHIPKMKSNLKKTGYKGKIVEI